MHLPSLTTMSRRPRDLRPETGPDNESKFEINWNLFQQARGQRDRRGRQGGKQADCSNLAFPPVQCVSPCDNSTYTPLPSLPLHLIHSSFVYGPHLWFSASQRQ